MSEQSFEELLNEQESIRIYTGAVVTGTVELVKENEAVLTFGGKIDGILPKSEYSNDSQVNLLDEIHVGDELEVKVIAKNDGDGRATVSYKRLAQSRMAEALKEPFENKEVLKGTVTDVVKGGLIVDYQGAQVFIPASLVSDKFERNLDKFKGQEVEFVLIEFNPAKRRIVGDRKSIVTEQKEAARKELLERISEGMIVTGKVKNLTDFGAFIDLGGADGLLHVAEMTWGRIDNPRKLYKVGDEVEAYIKSISDDKIALSVKFPEKNPWTEESPYAEGNIVTGKVARFTDFGAFVELEPGIDGLLHVSQIAYEHIAKPSDVLKAGDEVTVKVFEFTPEEHKISLSLKALLPEPEVKEAAEEAPAEEAPAEEAPAEEAPVEEAPAEEAPAEEAPAEEAPAEEAPAEEAAE